MINFFSFNNSIYRKLFIMKNNNTKERLFEVTGKLDKTFKPKLNEDIDWGNIAKEKYGVQNWDTMNDIDKESLIKQMEKTAEHDTWVKKEFGLPEQVTAAAQTTNVQQTDMSTPQTQYADQTYKMIAPALQRIRTVDQFPAAFKGWFSALGYKPQASPLTIAQVRIDVEQVMRELGYK